jgi:cytochrome c oxidase cbb3-type subunit 3
MTPDSKGPGGHGTDDLLLDHEYDGIKEYDNPMPKWWLYLFYVSIAYGVLYFIKTPGTGGDESVLAEYRADSTAAAAMFAKAEAARPKMGDAELVAMVNDKAAVAAGQATFTKMCASCHRADGGGMIGPNLADSTWLHVSTAHDIVRLVAEGVPAKGMPAWQSVLKPQQVNEVSAYVLSLQGTGPTGGKAPQGTVVALPGAKGLAPTTGATTSTDKGQGGAATATREALSSGG